MLIVARFLFFALLQAFVQCQMNSTIESHTTLFNQPSGCNSARLQSGERGSFSSTNYPENYNNNSTCEWFIIVSTRQKIKLTFKVGFAIEKSSSKYTCYDSLTVFNGSNANSEKIGEYCGAVAPDPVFVNNNQAFVTFKSDSSTQRQGFSVLWEAVDNVTNEFAVGQSSGCNSPRQQSGERGTFSSMNYPEKYDSSSKCDWLITVPSNKILKLTFNDNFGLEKMSYSSGCHDSVNIYKLSNAFSETIGEFCGTNAPNPIFVNSNQVNVTFKSDGSTQLQGFSIQWEAVFADDQLSGCGSPRRQSGQQGTFNSINYPQNYGRNSMCEWLITVAATKIIKLTFNDEFETEKSSSNDMCYDSIRVFNGTNNNSEIIGVYCGKIAPSPILVPNNQAFVTFKSDGNLQLKGFSLQWAAVDKLMYQSNVGQSSGCNSPRQQSGKRGTFSSMNYPRNYDSSSKCDWLITVPSGKIVKLTFNNNFRLEKTVTLACHDSVNVYKGSNAFSEKIGEYCGTRAPGPIFVNSSQAFVTFKSDSSLQFGGFSVRWEAVSSEFCPKIQSIHGGGRILSHSNESTFYSPNQICSWYIASQPNHGTILRFINFDLENGINCPNDNITVSYLDSNQQTQALRIFCGSTIPQQLTSQHGFKIEFKTDRSVEKSGFTLEYTYSRLNYLGQTDLLYWKNSVFYYGKSEKTWSEARKICREIWPGVNGDLVTVNDDEKNIYLSMLFANNTKHMMWIGANDIRSEGKFEWTDNSSLQFSRWENGEPNNQFGDEDCVQLHLSGNSAGRWNDISCSFTMWFICERKTSDEVKLVGLNSSYLVLNKEYPSIKCETELTDFPCSIVLVEDNSTIWESGKRAFVFRKKGIKTIKCSCETDELYFSNKWQVHVGSIAQISSLKQKHFNVSCSTQYKEEKSMSLIFDGIVLSTLKNTNKRLSVDLESKVKYSPEELDGKVITCQTENQWGKDEMTLVLSIPYDPKPKHIAINDQCGDVVSVDVDANVTCTCRLGNPKPKRITFIKTTEIEKFTILENRLIPKHEGNYNVTCRVELENGNLVHKTFHLKVKVKGSSFLLRALIASVVGNIILIILFLTTLFYKMRNKNQNLPLSANENKYELSKTFVVEEQRELPEPPRSETNLTYEKHSDSIAQKQEELYENSDSHHSVYEVTF